MFGFDATQESKFKQIGAKKHAQLLSQLSSIQAR
jgi:hypothetical protein